jgi:NADPH-dependent curcumin reductase CurA
MVLKYQAMWPKIVGEIIGHAKTGKLSIKEDISYGLENAPECINKLTSGKNIGKVILSLEKTE